MQKKLLLISTSKSCKQFFKYISSIRCNTSIAHQPLFVPFDNADKIQYIHKKYDASISMTLNKNTLTFTRTFDDELIDTFEYEIKFSSCAIDIDINPIHFTVMEEVGSMEANMLIDLLACATRKVAVTGIKYVLFIKKVENGLVITYEDLNGKVLGPLIELTEKRHWRCENEVWDRATTVETEKKIKNVAINEMRDVVGTLHMEKQDLTEIQIKKPRRVKNKE